MARGITQRSRRRRFGAIEKLAVAIVDCRFPNQTIDLGQVRPKSATHHRVGDCLFDELDDEEAFLRV